MSDSYLPDNEPRYILSSLEELAAKKLPHAPTFRKAADEITRLRAALAAARKRAATEKTLRKHETKRANDNYASLTKHWLNESKLRELLTEIVEYNGGAGHALADEYVVARIDAALGGGDE